MRDVGASLFGLNIMVFIYYCHLLFQGAGATARQVPESVQAPRSPKQAFRNGWKISKYEAYKNAFLLFLRKPIFMPTENFVILFTLNM